MLIVQCGWQQSACLCAYRVWPGRCSSHTTILYHAHSTGLLSCLVRSKCQHESPRCCDCWSPCRRGDAAPAQQSGQSSPTGQNVVPENLDPKLMEELKRIKKIMLS